jgi:hypothetical protein
MEMVGDYRGEIRNLSASSAQYQHFKNYRIVVMFLLVVLFFNMGLNRF